MLYRIEWTYKTKQKEEILFSSGWVDGNLALKTGEEFAGNPRTHSLLFSDEAGNSWTLKEMKRLLAEIEEEPHDITVFFDGGFDKASSKAGLGAIIYFRQGKKKFRLRANEMVEELENNNEAEYAAFYFALMQLEELGVRNLPCHFKGDSQVVLKQLAGEWPCYEPSYNRWLDRIEAKIADMGLIPRYEPVERKENKEADKLATQALEGKIIHAQREII